MRMAKKKVAYGCVCTSAVLVDVGVGEQTHLRQFCLRGGQRKNLLGAGTLADALLSTSSCFRWQAKCAKGFITFVVKPVMAAWEGEARRIARFVGG